jgi:hypothetical protein
MKAPLALALLALTAPFAFAQQDANALRDQLRKIARPEGTTSPSKTASQNTAAARQAKRTSVSPKPILPLAGTYRGEIEVANLGQKPVAYAAQLQFDPDLNRSVISIDYPSAQLVRTINGKLEGNVFRGRSEGGFSGVVYNYAADFTLTFSRDHRTVKIRETPVHPPPGWVDDGKAPILRRSD